MLWHKRGVVGGVAFLVVVLSLMHWSGGGIVVTSRDSTLEASGRTSGDEFDLTDSSSAFGLYDNTIGESLPGAGGGTTSASASQVSNITAISIAGNQTGNAAAQVAELDAIAAAARSLLNVAFDVVDLPEAVTIQGHVESTFDAAARVTLAEAGGATILERIVDIGSADRIEFDESLTLAPGSYTLVAEARVTGTPAPNSAEFDLTISHAVIPLPAPLLGGGVMLLVGGRLCLRRQTIRLS